MAITIIKQPEEISFSRNQNFWGFKTDNLYSNPGTRFSCILSFPLGPLAEGDSFSLTYNSTQQNFLIKNYPDDSGTEIVAGKDHPLIADLTILEWCNKIIAALKANYLFSRDFDIELEETGLDPRVKLTAKIADPVYDVELSESSGINLLLLSNGIKKVRHQSFAIWFQLLVSNSDGTGFDIVLNDTFLDVDDEGEAHPNLSQTLTQALVGRDNDFEQPDPALPVVQKNLKSCRRYYIRYAEAYGSKQVIRKIESTSTKWVLLGGSGKAFEKEFSIPSRFFVDSKHCFLKQESLTKDISINHFEWLSFVWLTDPAAVVKAHVKVYFTSGDPEEFDAYTFEDIAKYDKITFPVGPGQLSLESLYDPRIVAYYEVWLKDALDTVLSEVRTYRLIYEYRPYSRWFVALSSFGSYDTYYTIGKGSTEYSLITQTANITQSHLFDFEKGEVLEFDPSLEQKTTVITGWITSKRELKRFRDLFLSWNKFEIINGRAFPVMLNSKNIKERRDDEKIYYLEFEVGYRFSDQAWTEDEDDLQPGSILDVSQFWPLASISDPENWDALYYRKTQTYNRTEIDSFISNLTAIEAAHHAAQQGQIDALFAALAGKSNIDHLHDGIYVTVGEFNEAIIAIANSIFYKGQWDADYSVAPGDLDTLPGYFINDIVDYAGTLWRSLFGNSEEPNEETPGIDPAKWEKIIEAKTQLSVTEPLTLNWQAGLISGKTYTWAQKYGNDLPGTAGAWWFNGAKWECFEGFQMDPTYDGATLLSVAITADLYPVKINLI